MPIRLHHLHQDAAGSARTLGLCPPGSGSVRGSVSELDLEGRVGTRQPHLAS